MAFFYICKIFLMSHLTKDNWIWCLLYYSICYHVLFCFHLWVFGGFFVCLLVFRFFVFWGGHTQHMWKFPGQGLNPSCICDLCHRCSNSGSLTYCTTVGTPTMFCFDWSIWRKSSLTQIGSWKKEEYCNSFSDNSGYSLILKLNRW